MLTDEEGSGGSNMLVFQHQFFICISGYFVINRAPFLPVLQELLYLLYPISHPHQRKIKRRRVYAQKMARALGILSVHQTHGQKNSLSLAFSSFMLDLGRSSVMDCILYIRFLLVMLLLLTNCDLLVSLFTCHLYFYFSQVFDVFPVQWQFKLQWTRIRKHVLLILNFYVYEQDPLSST